MIHSQPATKLRHVPSKQAQGEQQRADAELQRKANKAGIRSYYVAVIGMVLSTAALVLGAHWQQKGAAKPVAEVDRIAITARLSSARMARVEGQAWPGVKQIFFSIEPGGDPAHDASAFPDATGKFSTLLHLGNVGTGKGTTYSIQAFYTPIPPERWKTSPPDDAVRSNTVYVLRPE